MHGNADGARLVGNGARNGLANPPGGIRGELESLAIVELLDRANKTQVALLDKVEEEHAAAHVAFRDGHDEAQVCFDELLFRVETDFLDTSQAAKVAPLELDFAGVGLLKLLARSDARLDLHGEVDFLGSGEQRHLADFLQVHANRVACEHGHAAVVCALAGRTALAAGRRHLRQLHIGGCFKFFFGDALEQVFLLVDASLNLVFVERGVGGFGNLAYRGLSLVGYPSSSSSSRISSALERSFGSSAVFFDNFWESFAT